MPNIEQDRWDTALNRVARIERASALLKRRFFTRPFSYAKRSAWATPAGLEVLPAEQQPTSPKGHTRAKVRADSVLIGKFDIKQEVRFRAFYTKDGTGIRYQSGGKNNGVTRTVDAYEQVRKYSPVLMPEVYDYGTIMDNRGAFLIEETVPGRTATSDDLEGLITPVISQLHEVQRGVGIRNKAASEVLGPACRKRWNEFVQLHDVDPELDSTIHQLLNRDAFLEVSLTHGDLVNSNILIDGDKFTLVDWEFAREKPVAFDMAKMMISVPDVENALGAMQKGFGGRIGVRKSHYTLREQVALGILRILNLYNGQKVAAKKAGRSDALARETKMRVRTLQHLLELS